MRGSLFWRSFSAILIVVLVSVILFAAILVNVQRESMQVSLETEVLMQARQVADYLHHMNQLILVRGNATIQQLVNEKITDIYEKYNADIWLVSYDANRITYIDRSWNSSESIPTEAVAKTLRMIQEGNEIRATGLFPTELGEQIVTIGVPWTYNTNRVVGAVLLHIPIDNLNIRYSDVLPKTLLPSAVSLIIGMLLAYLVARSQSKPIRELERAVREFSTGDLSRRVNLNCGGELQRLGETINRMASELSTLEDSRRSFVANVSHELRSPMTSIRGYLQAMQDGTIPPEDHEKYIQIVLDEATRLSELVSTLLDLSRLESGRFPMNIQPFDANEMMRRILIRYDQRINGKNINVDIELAPDPCFAMGDANRINQVVSNFVDNAVKFMDGPDPVLTLKTFVSAEDKCVHFVVQDNGPGINSEDQAHIFDRFYKADKAHTSGMGTGLGLSISKNIIQQHGSTIHMRSVPGKTQFEFALPQAESSAVQSPPAGPELPAGN